MTLPDYIPKPIVDDYREACAIADLSPKASATISRRCLQGMIRDFWQISKPRLVEEIGAIKDKTDAETWEALDAVRKVGNIGAHMDKGINVTVDFDPNEARCCLRIVTSLATKRQVSRCIETTGSR